MYYLRRLLSCLQEEHNSVSQGFLATSDTDPAVSVLGLEALIEMTRLRPTTPINTKYKHFSKIGS